MLHACVPLASLDFSMLKPLSPTQMSSNEILHMDVILAAKLCTLPMHACSVTLAISHSCPPSMRREKWSADDFDVQKQLYCSSVSMVSY